MFMNVYMCVYVHTHIPPPPTSTTTIKEKKAMNLKEGKEVCAWESLEGRRERINDVILCYQNFKIYFKSHKSYISKY